MPGTEQVDRNGEGIPGGRKAWRWECLRRVRGRVRRPAWLVGRGERGGWKDRLRPRLRP